MPEQSVIKGILEKATPNPIENRWGDPRSHRALTAASMQAMLFHIATSERQHLSLYIHMF